MSKLALKTVAVGIVAFISLAGNSSAAAHSCAKAGYTVDYRDAVNVVMHKYVPGYWEKDGSATAVCSRAYGKVVVVGQSGTTGDGPEWSHPMAMNRRYTAVVDGYGGNAGGEQDTRIRVIDLKTGRQVSSSTPSSDPDSIDDAIVAVALNISGAVGWIDAYYTGVSGAIHVYVKYPTGRKRLLADVREINSDFLRWSDDGGQLLWSTSRTAFDYVIPKYNFPKPRSKKSCYRNGDRAEGRDPSYVYVSRPFKADNWRNGRALIACSLTFKRRVVIARSGWRGDERFSYRSPAVAEGFAAVLVRRERANGWTDQLATFDLSTARRTCIASVGGHLRSSKLGAIAFDGRGTTAWLASGKLLGGARATTVRTCANGVTRTLSTGPGIDTTYISFDTEKKQVVVVDLPQSGH